MAINPRRIVAALAEANQLLDELGAAAADERLKWDSLEGETRFFAVLDRLAELANGDKALLDEGTLRLRRIKARAEKTREVMRRMLAEVGMGKGSLERPLYTATVSYGEPPLKLMDETELPEAFIRHSPDSRMIKAALLKGQTVPGAVLGNPEPVLTLRWRERERGAEEEGAE